MPYILPKVINPQGTVCVRVNVPNDIAYLAAFWGQMLELARWYNWERDEAKQGRLAAARMWQMFREARESADFSGKCADCDDCNQPSIIIGDEDMGLRRWNANICNWEFSIDGIHWCEEDSGWRDCVEELIGNSTEGNGEVQPETCQTYKITLAGNNKWLVPAPVRAGYTIKTVKLSGAASDGTVTWYCPNGQPFVLGACVGSITPALEGDPSPDNPHMSVIGIIGDGEEIFQLVEGETYTVTGAVPDLQNLVIQRNDSVIGDNAGNTLIELEVCHTDTADTTWCYRVDFTQPLPSWIEILNGTRDSSGLHSADGSGYRVDNEGTGYGTRARFRVTMPNGGTIQTVTQETFWSASVSADTRGYRQNFGTGHNEYTPDNALSGADTFVTTPTIILGEGDEFEYSAGAGWSTESFEPGDVTYLAITFEGILDNPFGEDNCQGG